VLVIALAAIEENSCLKVVVLTRRYCYLVPVISIYNETYNDGTVVSPLFNESERQTKIYPY
jgi:hypothetical protein